MNTEINIWENLNLSEDNLKTAYHYLTSQTENFNKAVKGELKMEVEVNQIINSENIVNINYTLYIIAPQLGNFRKKILYVIENEKEGRFPVQVVDLINNGSKANVEEEELLSYVKGILATVKVKNVIEFLYRQSIEARKNKIFV